ncbi:MAG: hypothetical protein HRU38_05125 [Saccharospirillaceae bacterium]|nr:DUF1552 domain-containing protein [Pseudomonadales bacterium]NRB78039.1 hypothetical protein [Saccharospirillaceae bacterium]
MNIKMNRRQLFKNTAAVVTVSTLGSTSLKAICANTNKAKNVIFFYVPLGAPHGKWVPSMSNGEVELNECTQPYESVKQRCVFFDNMKTRGGQWRDLDGVRVGRRTRKSLIEIFAEKNTGHYPMNFLPITSGSGISYQVNRVSFHSNPWSTYDHLKEITAAPYIELLEKNMQHSLALIEQTTGLDKDEITRYQDKLKQKVSELNTKDGEMLAIPQRRGIETYAQRTDYQIINAVSAIKSNKTSVVHFVTGETNNQPLIDGLGDYHTIIHSGGREYILQRAAFDQKVADLIKLLEDTNDDSGEPLIDSTLVVLYSNEGDAEPHDNRESPYMLAGGSFLNGGQINSSDNQDEFLDTIIALMDSSYPYSSDNGPLLDIIA